MSEFHVIDLKIPEDLAGQRLDVALALLRQRPITDAFRCCIEAGQCWWCRLPLKPKYVVDPVSAVKCPHDRGKCRAPESPRETFRSPWCNEMGEPWVVDKKPVGAGVHPGPGNRSSTLPLQNALLEDPSLYRFRRAGIIRRLATRTPRLWVVARTPAAPPP